MKVIKFKKPSRKALIRKLDHVFSIYIRLRDGYCVVCGTHDNLTCGHLWSRTNYATRWDEENCYAQCAGDNLRHEYDPYPFQEFVRKKLGEAGYHSLHQRHVGIRKFKDFEIQELINQYKKKVDELAPGYLIS